MKTSQLATFDHQLHTKAAVTNQNCIMASQAAATALAALTANVSVGWGLATSCAGMRSNGLALAVYANQGQRVKLKDIHAAPAGPVSAEQARVRRFRTI